MVRGEGRGEERADKALRSNREEGTRKEESEVGGVIP